MADAPDGREPPDPVTFESSVAQYVVDEHYAAEIAALKDRDAVFDYVVRLVAQHGFPFFMLTTLPKPSTKSLSELIILSNSPESMIRGYDKGNAIQISPGFRRLKTSTTPFRLFLNQWRQEASSDLLPNQIALLSAIGLKEACYFPVHDAAGGRAVFIMFSKQIDLAINLMTDLHMIFLHVYDRLIAIGGVGAAEPVDLSEREVQCLSWTAAGKTSSEIAEILGLSEHTINHYLNHVARKLNAANRVQAVVNAMRLGLIN